MPVILTSTARIAGIEGIVAVVGLIVAAEPVVVVGLIVAAELAGFGVVTGLIVAAGLAENRVLVGSDVVIGLVVIAGFIIVTGVFAVAEGAANIGSCAKAGVVMSSADNNKE